MSTKRCPRCGAPLTAWSTSYFNTQEICLECCDDEKQAPGYQAAVATEEAEVQRGNYNFQGVGLSDADRAFLAVLLKERRNTHDAHI